jgi:hypothetical protein
MNPLQDFKTESTVIGAAAGITVLERMDVNILTYVCTSDKI